MSIKHKPFTRLAEDRFPAPHVAPRLQRRCVRVPVAPMDHMGHRMGGGGGGGGCAGVCVDGLKSGFMCAF